MDGPDRHLELTGELGGGLAAARLEQEQERDEPGCLQFNVLQDDQDENVYYFYEVYKDMAALEAHRAAPHYATWRAAADTLDGPTAPTRCKTVFPADRAYWGKM